MHLMVVGMAGCNRSSHLCIDRMASDLHARNSARHGFPALPQVSRRISRFHNIERLCWRREGSMLSMRKASRTSEVVLALSLLTREVRYCLGQCLLSLFDSCRRLERRIRTKHQDADVLEAIVEKFLYLYVVCRINIYPDFHQHWKRVVGPVI